MPETIRATGGSLKARLRHHRIHIPAVAGALSLLPSAAVAQDTAEWPWPFNSPYVAALARLEQHEVAALALILGAILFAVVTSILLVRTRARSAVDGGAAKEQIAGLKSQVDQLTSLLLSEPHVLVSWPAVGDEPNIIGQTLGMTGDAKAANVLAFGAWLTVDDARAMVRAVERLRAQGEAFSRTLTTSAGRQVEAEGRAIAGRAVMKLRDVSGIERKLAEVKAAHEALKSEADALRALIEALPFPVWVRDAAGTVAFANAAYGRPGQRRSLDVIEVPTARGPGSIGIDTTETETLRRELARLADVHRRTLDQIATGVATFAVDQKLTFHNAAYRTLWDLDTKFLDQRPTDSEVLDRLRDDRKLPDQRDFRQWKAQLHAAYGAGEAQAQAHVWHLPDGRTLRVVATPHPEGGVTYLFNDVTERLDLERRFDALINVQGETLDNLSEALAVFGSDGRIRLFNPAFTTMWRIDPLDLLEHPHIEVVIELARPLHGHDATWRKLRTAVTALDRRDPVALRIELKDDMVADCSTVPLPDGGTLVAFHDVTDSVKVERALRERNQALIAADETKIKFVRHVSYELRSPLTNIIGFAEFLDSPVNGPMTERQREYLSHITSSTNALLALINNILDLATIDARAMNLDLGEVDIRTTMAAAAEGIQDRLVNDGITLDIRAADDIGNFIADERRVTQVLFNLLSNAVGFSPPGETVTLAAERTTEAILFTVIDHGPGIPPETQDKVFEWFETNTTGSRHRGAGLGLSLVRSFVELHGGHVAIDATTGGGTTVVCSFPLDRASRRTAA
jgi:signal transduction histidine kinase